ncbi:MAG: tRNA (adenosine(37)-N6)-methyltransferase TrmM [Bacteroidetes bacterium HGW-Bacteroidetes-11]|jgi:tRNA1Val (adenine37-N6)-methyltransferase|nr:MAG: tRNA (adenosine(37)-N6)-methyltransferase TrmM [Bacteroidetes bacterium HGW-Bacteroidetes-11]
MPFNFKQFSVDDALCAMKVGTDSVLLGAWADVEKSQQILDIGTGCGLLALMAAQRCGAEITAIDIHQPSAAQAQHNFKLSSWAERLHVHCISLQDFAKTETNKFDHLITNPPYFINSLKSPDNGRNTARHNDELPLKSLVEFSAQLLTDAGRLSVVFPFADSQLLINLAEESSLSIKRQMIIIPKQGKEPNRILLEFTKGQAENTESATLAIRDYRGEYTQEYIKLTANFYLKLS